MSCLIFDCDQGSEDWHVLRAGCITASMFTVARSRVNGLTEQQAKYVEAILAGRTEARAREIAGYKTAPRAASIEKAIAGEPVGEFSDTAKNYAFRLAIERISGEPLNEGFENWAMKRGHELEPKARMEHERQSGLIVERAGFVKTEDGVFGASADGLIGKDGGSEYKCFIDPDKLRSFYIDDDASTVMDQAQGCMWITDREYWHICLYCPALKNIGSQLWWRVFKRDQNYIEKMEIELVEFKNLVDEYEGILRKRALRKAA